MMPIGIEEKANGEATLEVLKREFGCSALMWAIQQARQRPDWDSLSFHKRVKAIEEILRKKEDLQALILTTKRKPSKVKYSTFGKLIEEEI